MKIIKPTPLGILTRPYRAHGREHLGIAIPVMATLGATPQIVSESELWNTVGDELAGYTLDAAMPKSHAEFLVSANAYGKYCERGHRGDRANTCHVGIRFAGVEKQLHVSGERNWNGNTATAAKPFESLRIDWPHAYGGAGYADNPVGRGFSSAIGDDRNTPSLLPNIEYAANALTQRGQHAAPAALTPIAPSWPQRSALFGQLDEVWHEQDRPGFPRTMDRRYFNVAPLDQQLPAHTALPDGAAYAITRLHPEREVIAGVLPALRARSFIQRRQSKLLTEIAMRLTTAWFIPHRERVVMIFHGVAEIEAFDAHDIACLLIAAEASSQARSAEHYQRVFELRMDRQHGALHALRDSDLMPASTAASTPADSTRDNAGTPGDPSQGAWQRNLLNRARSLADEAALSAQHAGIPFPADAFATSPGPTHAPRLDDLAEFVQRQEQLASEQRAALDQTRQRIENEHAARCPPTAPRRGPPTLPHDNTPPVDPIDPVYSVQAGMADMAREATLKLRQAYRHAAHYQEAAPRLDANTAAARTIRNRVITLHANGESLAGLDLTGADLSGLSLRGALLSDAMLENADLTGADLTGATLSDAVLVRATLSRATLRGANLSRANLSLAHCDGTDFDEATLDGALFDRTQFHRCKLRRASVERARFSQCRFDSVDFREARLSDLAFIEQAFQHVDFSRAQIRKLALIQCTAEHVSFSEADIHGFACIDTSAAGIRFDRATLRQAGFLKDSVLDRADFSHATLSEVNFRQASAKGANFSHARIDQCDFSDACLHSANLQGVRIENGYLVRTDLRGARLAGADLIGGYLRGADLRGANLHEANLFRANLAEVLLDDVSRSGDGSQFDGAYLEQVVLHPLASPA
ncbi:DUF2169 family type VI secretion system accessory protein [Paraburkholderia bryophila]|uniref:Uncharacterized protein YjbI with pentapeptide repeats n=1 Tax=Paraburkholderia bryophila TaxID=420952 RepID=A0A7Z0B870_9BURK|nr:DUF2169 domain-containing protein [Paraburkholderia bryophila]NYH23540.1 uncharacterized protein YjbI with pentapeptide repeats [Paraburkholderia bryophila]